MLSTIQAKCDQRMNVFEYCPGLLAAYPDVCGGAIYATDLRNGPTPDGLSKMYMVEQARVRAELPVSLSEVPSLAAWRAAYRRFGANPTKHRSAAEALLRRLQKKGNIPSSLSERGRFSRISSQT